MKKVILPALLSVVLLTSCSQALYKNKYDWVKVNPIQEHPRVDSLSAKIESLPLTPEEFVEGIASNVFAKIHKRDSSTHVVNASRPETDKLDQSFTESVPEPPTATVESSTSNSETAEQKSESASDAVVKKDQSSSNIDWGEVAYEFVFFLVLFLLWYFRDNPVVAMITLILEGLFALGSIIAIIWVFVWVCRIFGQFITMMGE